MKGFKQTRGAKRPRICETCGETMQPDKKATLAEWNRRRFCSIPCKHWRQTVARIIAGDTRIHKEGYRLVFCPPLAGPRQTYVYEHRLIAERTLGRRLASHEYVHHKNEDVLDNRPENLEVLSSAEHRVLHAGSISDDEIRDLILRGETAAEIAARGVGSHRVVRVRRTLVGVPDARPAIPGDHDPKLKLAARRAVRTALASGTLQREPCEVCGEFAHAHHVDYYRPLDVRWLCATHHRRAHMAMGVAA